MNPIMLMGVYLLVFSVVWKSPFAGGGHYPLFLLSGLAVWTFFAASLQSATRSMLDNANLIRKIRFPRQLVPLSVVGAHLVSFAVMLVLLLVVNAIWLPRARATELLAIPLAVLVVGLLAGLALAVASLNVLFRDVEFIVAALLVPWFFLTPIIYPLTSGTLAEHTHVIWVIHWVNPLSPAVEAVRAPLPRDMPFWGDALYLVVSCFAALAVGAWVFTVRRPDRDRGLGLFGRVDEARAFRLRLAAVVERCLDLLVRLDVLELHAPVERAHRRDSENAVHLSAVGDLPTDGEVVQGRRAPSSRIGTTSCDDTPSAVPEQAQMRALQHEPPVEHPRLGAVGPVGGEAGHRGVRLERRQEGRQTSGCPKRGWRPPPGAYGASWPGARLRRKRPRSRSSAPPTAAYPSSWSARACSCQPASGSAPSGKNVRACDASRRGRTSRSRSSGSLPSFASQNRCSSTRSTESR